MKIKGLHGLHMKKYQHLSTVQFHEILKAVTSHNQYKSAVQTSYDIVKAHGGEIKVETKNSEGTYFTIHLPIDQ